ncbi:MAG: FAD-dependent oxidoreductase [Paracoccaceae bacterium]
MRANWATTGARNRVLPDLADATRMRAALDGVQRVLVVGGGFIGQEAAAALAEMGRQVTVLETAPRVLSRMAAPETSDRVATGLRALGVDLRLGWQGTGWRREDDRVIAALGADGEVACQLILVGIGASAEMTLAQAAGIACDRGILTDGWLRTSAPHVWALGDVAETPHWQADGAALRLESMQNATDQARHLARLLAKDNGAEFRTVPWFWSDIGPLKLQIAGLADRADRRLVRAEEGRLAVFHFLAGTLVAVETLNCPADHMLARQLIEAGRTPPDEVLMQGAAATKVWAAA